MTWIEVEILREGRDQPMAFGLRSDHKTFWVRGNSFTDDDSLREALDSHLNDDIDKEEIVTYE